MRVRFVIKTDHYLKVHMPIHSGEFTRPPPTITPSHILSCVMLSIIVDFAMKDHLVHWSCDPTELVIGENEK